MLVPCCCEHGWVSTARGRRRRSHRGSPRRGAVVAEWRRSCCSRRHPDVTFRRAAELQPSHQWHSSSGRGEAASAQRVSARRSPYRDASNGSGFSQGDAREVRTLQSSAGLIAGDEAQRRRWMTSSMVLEGDGLLK